MPEWTRDTPWRQGHLLTAEAIRAVINQACPDDTVVIVATHDCDLLQTPNKEPQVEVVIGRRIPELNGNNTHAKSPRTLHIGFEGSSPLLAEFIITEKRSLPKSALVDFEPETNARLSLPDLNTFQLWLASRYRRSAFPDEFERRLRVSGLDRKIANAVRPHGRIITAVFFDIDDGREGAHSEAEDVYILDIYLLYETEPDFTAAETAANNAKAEIKRAFETKLYNRQSHNWQSIELRNIDIISEDVMSFRQSKYLKKWRMDYISLGAEPQQPVLAE